VEREAARDEAGRPRVVRRGAARKVLSISNALAAYAPACGVQRARIGKAHPRRWLLAGQLPYFLGLQPLELGTSAVT